MNTLFILSLTETCDTVVVVVVVNCGHIEAGRICSISVLCFCGSRGVTEIRDVCLFSSPLFQHCFVLCCYYLLFSSYYSCDTHM